MCRYRALIWSCGHSRTFRLSTCRGTKQTWRRFGHELRRRVDCREEAAEISLRLSKPCKDCRRAELLADIEAQWAQSRLFADELYLRCMEADALNVVDDADMDWFKLCGSEREKYRHRCVRVRNWITAREHRLPGLRSSPAWTKCAIASPLARDLEGNPAWDEKIPIKRRVRAHLVE
ncbi:uncharacterized protein BDZ99DRAFT_150245 [Mytilinidion resinicola]|uniref:Uncharacterized protein n=1 Tax=Mytilinidion resinicola TaxID=574789 RepID=A0A6A6Y9L2_9PEZI|nr:uncharacterized protein BDZ99DRAFT_150245 [Mytilinidion resinicola]KAF2804674.1 hypothetical protein BDZ99DRAFT_150245 [Mytilinidion resinicola]